MRVQLHNTVPIFGKPTNMRFWIFLPKDVIWRQFGQMMGKEKIFEPTLLHRDTVFENYQKCLIFVSKIAFKIAEFSRLSCHESDFEKSQLCLPKSLKMRLFECFSNIVLKRR